MTRSRAAIESPAEEEGVAPSRTPAAKNGAANKTVGEAAHFLASRKRRPRAAWAAAAATGLSAALIVFLVLRYAVAIPMLDDWEMVAVATKAHTSGLKFTDLFEQQQESRTLLPKLIFIALSFAKYWDSRVVMMLSVLICCLTALGLYRLLGRSGLAEWPATIVFLLAVFLIFSPTQHEIWLLASGFPSFVPAFCVLSGIAVTTSGRSIAARFWICVFLALCASFTLSNGLLAWGLTFPILFATDGERVPKRWLGYWLIAAAACAAVYFWQLRPQPDLPAFAPRKSVLEYCQYVAAFLGSGLGRAGNEYPLTISTAIGATLLVAYGAVLVHLIIRRRDRLHRARVVPWLALGGYSIGNACLAALGRIGWGVAQALESRYVAYSIYLAIAIVVLAAIYWTQFWQRSSRSGRALPAFAVAVFLVLGCLTLELLGAIDSLAVFRIRSAAARLGQSAILFSRAIDTSETIKAVNYPRPHFVYQNADTLDRLRLLRTRLLRTREVAKIRHAEAEDKTTAGWWDELTTDSDGARTAHGWAALLARNRSADGVVLAYANERGEWMIFAHSDAVLRRGDVAATLRSAEQLWSGWRVRFSADAVPAGAVLTAWAVDAREAKLYRLKTKATMVNP